MSLNKWDQGPAPVGNRARTNRPDRSDFLFTALIGLAASSAVFVRWYGLNSKSLWWDEGFTVWLSKFSTRDICRALQTDTSPPLYYLLQHLWIRWFGISEVSLRGLSAFFETLSLPVFYFLARRILVEKTAVTLAMWLYALNAFQVEYAKEARFYGLLTFLCLVSIYSLIVFLEKRTAISFCALILSLSASLYTHNMMFFYLPAIALVWLVYPSAQPIRRRFVDGTLCAAIVLLSFLPWVPTLWSQWKSIQHSFWVPRPTTKSLAYSLCTLSGFYTDFLHDAATRIFHLPSLITEGVIFWAAVMILVFCALGALRYVLPLNRRKASALLAYSVTPVFLSFFVSRITAPVYLDRAFIASSAILPMVFSAPIAFQAGVRRMLFLTVGIAVLAATALSLYGNLRYSRKEDWRAMTDYVLRIQENPRLIVFLPSKGRILFDYYSAKSSGLFPPGDETGLPRPFDLQSPVPLPRTDFSHADPMGPLEQAMESDLYSEIDVVISHARWPEAFRKHPEFMERVLKYLGTHCAAVEDRDFYNVLVKRCIVHPEK